MKKTITLICFVISLFSCKKDETKPTSEAPSTLTQDLLLYMPFNSSLADSSGNANSATAFGALSYNNNRYFENGKSLVLNGTNNRVEISGSKFDTLSRFTIYMEFMPYNSNPMSLLSRTQFVNSANMKQAFSLMINYGSGTRFQMKKAGNCDNVNTATAFAPEVTGNGIPSINGWNYVAVTYDGNTVQTYLNGNLVGSSVQQGATLCSGAPLIIGSWWEGDAHYFAGQVDELRLYKRALSKDEVSQIHQLHK